MFQPVYTSDFELGRVCILYIVNGYDVPLAWNCQSKEHSRLLKTLSECKHETFSWGLCAHKPGF